MMGMIFDYLWHSVIAQVSLGVLIIAGLLALAWFVPFLRRPALEAAAGVFVVLGAYAKGARDANQRALARQAAIENKSVAEGADARARADRDAAGGVRDGGDADK